MNYTILRFNIQKYLAQGKLNFTDRYFRIQKNPSAVQLQNTIPIKLYRRPCLNESIIVSQVYV